VLKSCQVRPSSEDNFYRGEGVAIVLLDWAVHVWKAAGSNWKSWSCRSMSVTLKCGDARLLVIFCPTRAANRERKDKVL